MPPSKFDLTVNDAIDVLATNTNRFGTELFLSPPDDVNCFDEDSGDEDDPQLSDFSKKQLLAQCHLRITQNNGDETAEIDDNTPEVDSTSAFGSLSSNDWKRSEGENEKQHALRQKVKNFKAP